MFSELLAERCSRCGKRQGFFFGLRGFGLRARGHEARCLRRALRRSANEANGTSAAEKSSPLESLRPDGAGNIEATSEMPKVAASSVVQQTSSGAQHVASQVVGEASSVAGLVNGATTKAITAAEPEASSLVQQLAQHLMAEVTSAPELPSDATTKPIKVAEYEALPSVQPLSAQVASQAPESTPTIAEPAKETTPEATPAMESEIASPVQELRAAKMVDLAEKATTCTITTAESEVSKVDEKAIMKASPKTTPKANETSAAEKSSPLESLRPDGAGNIEATSEMPKVAASSVLPQTLPVAQHVASQVMGDASSVAGLINEPTTKAIAAAEPEASSLVQQLAQHLMQDVTNAAELPSEETTEPIKVAQHEALPSVQPLSPQVSSQAPESTPTIVEPAKETTPEAAPTMESEFASPVQELTAAKIVDLAEKATTCTLTTADSEVSKVDEEAIMKASPKTSPKVEEKTTAKTSSKGSGKGKKSRSKR